MKPSGLAHAAAAASVLLSALGARAQSTPDAGAAQVKEAQEQAKKAELTPIRPSPGDITKPAFQLYAEIDLPVLGVGLVFGSARLFRTSKAYCAPQCDPNELNVVDQLTAGYWSPAWSTASDLGLYTVAAGAATLLFVDEGPLPALNDAVVIAESALSATALQSMMTIAAGRPRPYLYGTNAPLEQRNSADGNMSFLSSHTSITAAITTSTYMAMRRLHPHSVLPTVELVVGLAATAFVATARLEGGQHFISDVVGGAVVGASLGILVPALHGSPVKVVPMPKGLGIEGKL